MCGTVEQTTSGVTSTSTVHPRRAACSREGMQPISAVGFFLLNGSVSGASHRCYGNTGMKCALNSIPITNSAVMGRVKSPHTGQNAIMNLQAHHALNVRRTQHTAAVA